MCKKKSSFTGHIGETMRDSLHDDLQFYCPRNGMIFIGRVLTCDVFVVILCALYV